MTCKSVSCKAVRHSEALCKAMREKRLLELQFSLHMTT